MYSKSQKIESVNFFPKQFKVVKQTRISSPVIYWLGKARDSSIDWINDSQRFVIFFLPPDNPMNYHRFYWQCTHTRAQTIYGWNVCTNLNYYIIKETQRNTIISGATPRFRCRYNIIISRYCRNLWSTYGAVRSRRTKNNNNNIINSDNFFILRPLVCFSYFYYYFFLLKSNTVIRTCGWRWWRRRRRRRRRTGRRDKNRTRMNNARKGRWT